ncbi:GDP-mannose 4,6-dehydratase [Nocardioides marmotae]|uniref:GDP-mannose 4,6-dehydratase n=1 Tax=Nocardioides marmotae TaxID=2663857 RepID=UPI0012B629CA|nr:GDP-mannose 4,6-dehydratase [Nocardioides marmotae]MBC9735323.1 GDP-mannose 4,6-dehydratase [Nocardioides marmotae]MTB86423.1 NAD-dependent epimerase/dehydratase family protein [Nocardioides marmotae]
MVTALVTGVAGQDGIYLARELLARGTRVVGTVRPASAEATGMAAYLEGVDVRPMDIRDTAAFAALVDDVRPDRVFNLAGLSSVGRSWGEPELTEEVNGAAVERMLEVLGGHSSIRFFQASSAEELGDPGSWSPYARSKARARAAVERARAAGAFACVATLYNHESPVRGPDFVTRKITRAAAEIALGRRERLTLGNTAVTRDWGFAGDYARAMADLLGLDEPHDVVLATGVGHTLDDLVRTAFAAIGIDDPAAYVEHDPALMRPADVPVQVGDPSSAARLLGWRPRVAFERLVRHMVEVDRRRLETGVEEDPAYLLPPD